MLIAEPVIQKLSWRGEAERGVLAFSVVERFDVIEQISLCLILRTIADAMNPLILQTVEETLGRRVVPARRQVSISRKLSRNVSCANDMDKN